MLIGDVRQSSEDAGGCQSGNRNFAAVLVHGASRRQGDSVARFAAYDGQGEALAPAAVYEADPRVLMSLFLYFIVAGCRIARASEMVMVIILLFFLFQLFFVISTTFISAGEITASRRRGINSSSAA
jgi:hypothetical protein